MTDLFSEAFGALSNTDFLEVPVDIETFVQSEEFLGLPPLSDIQYEMIRAGSQVYKEETLVGLYGEEKGRKRFNQTCNEIILQLGKGNIADCQSVYSIDRGYVPANTLMSETWDADTRRAPQPATPFYDEGEDDVFRITTKHGYFFDCGPNHKTPVWKNTKHMKNYTMRQEQMELPTVALSKGDIVELKVGWSEPKPVHQYQITADEARLIGYMIGDGTYARYQRKSESHAWSIKNPMFTNATKEVQEDFVRIVESLGGSVTSTASGMGCWQVRVCGINSWFERHHLVQHYNTQKSWNNQWLSMSNANMAELIKGVFATDGWISFTAAGKKIGNGVTKLEQAQAGIEMTSEDCIRGLHLALLKVGIVSKFKKHRDTRNNGKHKANYRVCVTDTTRVQDLMRLLKDIPGKTDRVGKVLSMKVKSRAANDHGDRIESIEYLGRHATVGTMVELEHNFNAGGIITCNSGKDYSSTIMCSYIAYLLCCLKDPAGYYGKPNSDTIDILNIAVNADQARNVFFVNLKKRITNCHWFDGKYNPTQNSIEFDNGVRIFSGHSERESFEGLNLIVAVLDEISAFPLESATGNKLANTADATYKMYRASVDSRFPDYGKVIMLSFPRFKDDYIQQRYNAVVAEKEVITRSRTLKLDPDLPDGIEGNEVKVEWDEDHITQYKYPRMFALKKPTWEVNPLVDLNSPAMVRAAAENYEDFLGRFACMPSDNTDAAFIKNKQAIEDTLVLPLNVDNNGTFRDDFQPKPDTKYFMHVDLSKVHDRCSVALAHVEKWQQVRLGETYESIEPFVVVDAIRWWKPDKFKPMDYEDVIQYILAVRQRGFDIKLVSFDRWNSIDTMNSLERHHIRTAQVSVAQKHYDDFLTMLYGSRLLGPNIEEFKEELRQLQWIKGKVDHPRSGYKDITDSFIGAVHNAVEGTPKPIDTEIEIKSLKDVYKENRKQESEYVIKPPKPKQQMPAEFSDYLSRMKLL